MESLEIEEKRRKHCYLQFLSIHYTLQLYFPPNKKVIYTVPLTSNPTPDILYKKALSIPKLTLI